MKIEIKSWNGSVLFEGDFSSLAEAVVAAVKKKADLRGADLREANLRGADLSKANLRKADLREADLSKANLREADLSKAYLGVANLRGADLSKAYLGVANLRWADLSGAKNADSVILETGETLKVYREKVVPELLAAGGHKVSSKAWDCHSWDNCPMAQAFDIHNTEDAPLLLRPRVEQFVRLFDARLIPLPECVKKNEKPAPQATQEG